MILLTNLSRDRETSPINISEMSAGLWLGVVIVSLAHVINTAEKENPPAGSQYSKLVDTTERAGAREQLVSHRDIRVMLSVQTSQGLSPFYFPVHHLGNFGLLGRSLPTGPPLPPAGAGQEGLQT